MNKVALDLGPLQIYWYSIFVFIGLTVGCSIIYFEAKKRDIDENFLINLIFNSIIIGLIGARAYYVLFNLNYYLSNPLEILAVWNGGLAIHGGIFAGLIFVIIYCKKHKVNILKMLDIIVLGLIIGQSIGRWGNFFNSEAYGAITTVENLKRQGIPMFIINGMYILGEYRQPAFFYESVWCLCGFLAMLIIKRSKYLRIGQLSGFYLIWYGISRFLIEGIRTDSLMLGSIKIAQIVSILFIISGIILFIYNKKKDPNKNHILYNQTYDEQEENIVYFKEVE